MSYQSPQNPIGRDITTPSLIASCSSTHSQHSSHTNLLSVLQTRQLHFCFKAIAHAVLFYCNTLITAYFTTGSLLYFMSQLNCHLLRETFLTILSVEVFLDSGFFIASSFIIILCLLGYCLYAPTKT